MQILNFTQHNATPEQVAAGVVDPVDHGAIRNLLTFDELPSDDEIRWRAQAAAVIAKLAKSQGFDAVMIGGAPFFMARSIIRQIFSA